MERFLGGGPSSPTKALSDEDAGALTAFLMMQKTSGKPGAEAMKRLLWIPGAMALVIAAGLRAAACGCSCSTSNRLRLCDCGVERRGSIGSARAALPQPLVVQVNDAQGNAVTGAFVIFSGKWWREVRSQPRVSPIPADS